MWALPPAQILLRCGAFDVQSFFLVGLGGAIGAIGRYGFSVLALRYWTGTFPLATLLINIVGSFAMGLLMGLLAKLTPDWGPPARLFLAVGILGGFTTFSAFSLEVIALLERGEISASLTYALLSVVVSVAALYFGLLITRGAVI
jgi:CrcB protein